MKDWETRYKNKKVRCKGSRGPLKQFKWAQIKKWAGPIHKRSVIDVGCGDLRFWKWKPKPADYIGIDISETALLKAQKSHKAGQFYQEDSARKLPIKAEVVLCMDLIFHLMDKATLVATLENLADYSTDMIFIYTWVRDPWPYDQSFQKYWFMPDYFPIFTGKGFVHETTARSMVDPVGGLFVFRKSGI